MEFDEEQLQAYLSAYQGFDSNYPNGISLADTSGRIYQASTTKKVNLREPDENGNYVSLDSRSDLAGHRLVYSEIHSSINNCLEEKGLFQ